MLFQRNKKGDMSFQMILVILAVIALIVLVFFLGDFKALLSDFSADVEEAFADCDLDGIENKIDRCPCLSTLGDSEKEPSLIGCPVPTTTLDADNDRKTCTTYEISEGKYSEECDKDNPKDCKTRCDTVHGTSAPVEDKQPGIETDGDLTVEVKKFGDLDNTGFTALSSGQRVEYDLASLPEAKGKVITDSSRVISHLSLPLQLGVKNIGTGFISHDFKVEVSICNELKQNCVSKGLLSVDKEIKQSMEEQLSSNIEIGNKGDSCDGSGIRKCYVKIVVDAEQRLQETREDNNEIWVLVQLNNQVDLEQFPLYQIMAVIDDGSDGDIIDEYCEGDSLIEQWLISSSGDSSQPAHDFSFCVQQFTDKWKAYGIDGSFPSSVASEGNCWVFVVEDDSPSENVGAGSVVQGKIIKYSPPKPEKIIPTGGLSPESNKDVAAVFEKPWSSNKGGLICKKNWWHLCDKSHEGNVLMVNEQRFVCNNQNWEQRN